MQNLSHYAIPLLLILWIIYRRTKNTIGFQRLSTRRLKFRIGLFGVIGVLLLALGFAQPIHFLGYAAGIAAGVVLGLIAIRYTRFEQRADGWYYRTHLWVEIAVLVLFLGRIGYRVAVMALSSSPTNLSDMNPLDISQFAKDPLTAGVFFVLVTYYILFFSYLLREEVKLEKHPLTQDNRSQ